MKQNASFGTFSGLTDALIDWISTLQETEDRK